MEKLENIVLKKGDKITFSNKEFLVCNDLENWNAYDAGLGKLIKIERVVEWEPIPKELNPLPVIAIRPRKYETIYEAPKAILNKEEKEYLEVVLRPFKDRIRKLIKRHSFGDENLFVKIRHFNTDSNDSLEFPEFEPKTKYKGMELNKEYTLKELGLFE